MFSILFFLKFNSFFCFDNSNRLSVIFILYFFFINLFYIILTNNLQLGFFNLSFFLLKTNFIRPQQNTDNISIKV